MQQLPQRLVLRQESSMDTSSGRVFLMKNKIFMHDLLVERGKNPKYTVDKLDNILPGWLQLMSHGHNVPLDMMFGERHMTTYENLCGQRQYPRDAG